MTHMNNTILQKTTDDEPHERCETIHDDDDAHEQRTDDDPHDPDTNALIDNLFIN